MGWLGWSGWSGWAGLAGLAGLARRLPAGGSLRCWLLLAAAGCCCLLMASGEGCSCGGAPLMSSISCVTSDDVSTFRQHAVLL